MKKNTIITVMLLLFFSFSTINAQTELFTNSNFNTDVNGWSASSNATLTWETGGYAKLTKGAGDAWNSRVGQIVSGLEVGKNYNLKIDINEINGNADVRLWNSDTQNWTNITSTGVSEVSFTASQIQTTFWWYTYGDANSYSIINSFSLKEDTSLNGASIVPGFLVRALYTDRQIAETDLSIYTDIMYGSVHVRADGSVITNSVSNNDIPIRNHTDGPTSIRPVLPNNYLKTKVHEAGANWILDVFGASGYHTFFDDVNKLVKFNNAITGILNIVNTNGFDGVMIDLENIYGAERLGNYIEFMTLLRAQLGPNKKLGYSGSTFMPNDFPSQEMLNLVDFYFIMAYDMRFGHPNGLMQQTTINRHTQHELSLGFNMGSPTMKSSIRDFNLLTGKEKIVFGATFGGEVFKTNSSDRNSIFTSRQYIGYGHMKRTLANLPTSVTVYYESYTDNFSDRIWYEDPDNPGQFIQFYYQGENTLTEQFKLIKSAEFQVGIWAIFYDRIWNEDQYAGTENWRNTHYFTNALDNWNMADEGTKQNPIAIETNTYSHTGNTENGSLFFTKKPVGENREIYGKEMVYKIVLSSDDIINITLTKETGDTNTDLTMYLLGSDLNLDMSSIIITSTGDFSTGQTEIVNQNLSAGTYYVVVKTLVNAKIGREGPYTITTTSSTLKVNSYTTNSINIYPNPATNSLTIKQTQQELKNYTITNTIGQKVAFGMVNNVTIDISNLEKGIYFIKLANDKKSITKKFIKQ